MTGLDLGLYSGVLVPTDQHFVRGGKGVSSNSRMGVSAVSEGWTYEAACSLFLWICHHSSYINSEGSYLSSNKEAGNSNSF